MSSAQITPEPRRKYTVEEYLAFERESEERHEYFDGEIVAMAGEKLEHGIISTNILISLGTQLKGTPCFAVAKDTKIRSGLGVFAARLTKGMFSYPDVVVICGEPEFFDEKHDIIMNPSAIVEVLSKSTELYDRGEKFRKYRSWNPSLKDYVLVSQSEPLIEHFRREADGDWKMHEASGMDASMTFSGIACVLKLADVYDRIKFEVNESESPPAENERP